MYLESYKGSRIEPAGLMRLNKQLTKAEQVPLELRRKIKVSSPRGKKRETGKAWTRAKTPVYHI